MNSQFSQSHFISGSTSQKSGPKVPGLSSMRESKILAEALCKTYRDLSQSISVDSVTDRLVQYRRERIRIVIGTLTDSLKNFPNTEQLIKSADVVDGQWLSDRIECSDIAQFLESYVALCDGWSNNPSTIPNPFQWQIVHESIFMLGVSAIFFHRTDALVKKDWLAASYAKSNEIEKLLSLSAHREIRDFPDAMSGRIHPASELDTRSAIFYERKQLYFTAIMLNNFLFDRLSTGEYKVSALDNDFGKLLRNIRDHTSHIFSGQDDEPGPGDSLPNGRVNLVVAKEWLKFKNGTPSNFEPCFKWYSEEEMNEALHPPQYEHTTYYDPSRASDVIAITSLASDLLLLRSDQEKHALGALSQQLQPFSPQGLLSAPDKALGTDENGYLSLQGQALRMIGTNSETGSSSLSPVEERREAILQSTGIITALESITLSLVDSLDQAAELAQGGTSLVQNVDGHSFRFLEELRKRTQPHLPRDVRTQNNPSSVTVRDLTNYLGRIEQETLDLFEGSQPGGQLVSGRFGAMDHQVPVGIDPVASVASHIARGFNGAHVGATHFPELESLTNDFVQNKATLLRTTWPKGQAITTTGGTASNNLSASLAYQSAGAGLALKRACTEMGITLGERPIAHGKTLHAMTDEEALKIHSSILSDLLSTLDGEKLAELQKNYRRQLKEVHNEYTPVVAFPAGEWVHYTLEGALDSYPRRDIVRIPLNADTELDFDELRKTVSSLFEDKVRPLIIPLTFCNTGLGRAGFKAESVLSFNHWFQSAYDMTPTYIIDAAQGCTTLGLSAKENEIPLEVADARDLIGQIAQSITLDPHKTYLPLPASIWVVKDVPWATFATARSIGHSYLEVGDASVLREAHQLSTPLDSAFYNLMFMRGLENGRHREIFAPVMNAATHVY